ncbi:MAG TPA: disulfide bond formation protein B, partial [Azospirillaceae bacterium]|nr:disulfide bond formation protein B [Azospirillaceae bacterium]
MPPRLGARRSAGYISAMDLSLNQPRLPALAIIAASLGVLGAALFFQFVIGLQPCILCIWQRWPYVIAGALAAGTLALPHRPKVRAAVLAAAGLTF